MKKLIIILLLLISYPVFAHHYYVSVTDGDDSDTGLTPALAWATIAKVNGFAFAAGDTVSFNKGDTWRELLTIPRAGAADTYMVYNAYGTGDNPRLLGSNTTTWTDQGSNIWKSDQTFTDPYGGTYDAQAFFENTNGTVTWGVHVANTGALTAEYNWTWASNYVYVYAATDPDVRYTSVEVPQRSYVVALNSKNYLHFDSIDIHYSILAGYVFGGWPQASQTGLIIENSNISHIGIKNSENAYGIDAGYSNMTVRGCDISNCGRRAISFHLYGLGWTQTNVLVEDNYFHDGWHTTGPDISIGSSGYYTASIDGMIIRRNKFYDPPTTAAFSELIFIQNSNGGVAGATMNNIYIYSNIFINSSNGGIHMETANGINIYNNTFYNHNTSYPGNTFHINIAKVSPGYCTNIKIKNNIFYTTGTYSSSGNVPIFVKSGALVDYTAVDADYNLYYRYNSSVRVIEIESVHNYPMTEIATLRTNTGWEAHGDFVSADMVDPANEDFQLNEGSPAIATGVDLDLLLDYAGNPFAATPSIGAIEYNTEPPVLVTSINVAGAAGATTITADGGTLQIYSDVAPDNATDTTVVWSRTNGTGEGNISASGLLTAVTDGTITVRATANDGSGIYDEQEITISNQTPTPGVGLPTVLTTGFLYNTAISAVIGGYVTDDGAGTISARGICWASECDPTVTDSHINIGTGEGYFIGTITGLTPGQTIYARAFVTNEEGTSYSVCVGITLRTYSIMTSKTGKVLKSRSGKLVVIK